MGKVNVKEFEFYAAVGEWFRNNGLAHSWAAEVARLTLCSVDVLGGGPEGATVACELKLLAYPNGSAGAGAIGQAFSLKVFVPHVYVALVVGETLSVPDCSWSNPKDNQRKMAELLQVNWPDPKDFSSYCTFVAGAFRAQFAETGLGLLVINADDDNAVKCVVEPTASARQLPQPKQWLDRLELEAARSQ